MSRTKDAFTRFEHEGWERVANRYDSVWASLTRQFIPLLLDAVGISRGMSVLDVACGPGYVAAAANERGAVATGVDFAKRMVAIAREMFPGILFVEGDAQHLPCTDAAYDRVLLNFGLLHLSRPEKSCAEAFRVLKAGGKFGFTVWASPPENPGAKIVRDALDGEADLTIELPSGPPYYLYANREECRKILEQVGFEGGSLRFRTEAVEWKIPTARYLFEAERDAGVRTAGLLARQSPARLKAISHAIEEGVRRHACAGEFSIPMAAHLVTIAKS
jgi:ubiquinone/menaquinone biosynthesis C-methylase UbiE